MNYWEMKEKLHKELLSTESLIENKQKQIKGILL